jgi:hypothetical protein
MTDLFLFDYTQFTTECNCRNPNTVFFCFRPFYRAIGFNSTLSARTGALATIAFLTLEEGGFSVFWLKSTIFAEKAAGGACEGSS